MDKREDALREALSKNAEETERWKTYRHENETAIENLDRFGKHLAVDVMVPIGSKAFMPGQLVHTNEILVGHYQGYFSKCSAHVAQKICEQRIKRAEEQLKQLMTESELWQNKLEKPYVEGVLSSGNERDIIEPYDEVSEQQWRIEHKKRVKQFKQEERKEREREQTVMQPDSVSSNEKTDDEIFNMLEEAELMEELEKELDALDVDEINDETIKKLMSGEMKLPQKERIAHNTAKQQKEQSNKEHRQLHGVIKRSELNSTINSLPQTNNNFRPNPELLQVMLNRNDDGNDEVDSDTEHLPEVEIIKQQATFLSKEDQIGFYEYQIQIIKQKLLTIPLRDQDGINEKIRLHQVLEELEELLEIVEETIGAEILAKEEEDEIELEIEQEKENSENDSNGVKLSKRGISFASENQTLEFRKNDTVKEMLPKRDIIRLNEPITKYTKDETPAQQQPIVINKKQSILNRVEQNRKFVEEHQSERDFDVVSNILDSSLGRENTLHITFKHSAKMVEPEKRDNLSKPVEFKDNACDIPRTPSDLYEMYLKSLQETKSPEALTIYLNGYEGEEDVKAPILCEAQREQAYLDPRMEFSKTVNESKSILRNKEAVKNEKRTELNSNQKSANNKKKKKNTKVNKNEDEFITAYEKVMSDVIEKPLTEPEPLPNCKYIDAHTPKQRVSRFKQMRANTQNT